MEILSGRTILRPVDYEKTLAFYRDGLGLAVHREYGAGTVFFAGQSLIEIAAHGSSGSAQVFDGALWLQVRDAEAAADELRGRGVPIERDAKQESWGLIEMWLRDPDGVPIVLVEIPADHPLRRDTRG
ncbi:glyoxalase [Rhodococcus sp. RS1C4]|uniref:VOC family protein n=1 Tax=Nocardiaceae TaxID=85025 RepID=UPI0003738C0B|nr:MULTISPECIES: VOC family protein [Rhodococcus]OZC51267.1 glyoxalase [Rhodococcus sp. RS1C4]OZC57259.1 glyoxalase [Rhodococcus sp. 06-621-2]OZC91205.1 glyoxalase [Rhodococcus sp. 06-418-1B]OZD10743.1 glyoxalase [Rhodococcus sp. 06-156-4C]OZD23204.1 glyoxalase [Rhodococcus sp. 06-156-3C]